MNERKKGRKKERKKDKDVTDVPDEDDVDVLLLGRVSLFGLRLDLGSGLRNRNEGLAASVLVVRRCGRSSGSGLKVIILVKPKFQS